MPSLSIHAQIGAGKGLGVRHCYRYTSPVPTTHPQPLLQYRNGGECFVVVKASLGRHYYAQLNGILV